MMRDWALIVTFQLLKTVPVYRLVSMSCMSKIAGFVNPSLGFRLKIPLLVALFLEPMNH